jgi:hypothetical protein
MTGSELSANIAGERKVIRALCKAALAKGFTLSYNDGEEWAVKRTSKLSDIMAEVHSTDEGLLLIRDSEAKKRANFYLIYGNSPDEVIADYGYQEADRALADDLYNAAYQGAAMA